MEKQLEALGPNLDSPMASIVVPTHNRMETTIKLISSIRAQSKSIQIFICDSGSSDGTVEALENMHNVEIIHVGTNAWWSAAVNQGIKKVISRQDDAVLIMNDDIVFDDGLIAGLLKKHQQYPFAIISPMQETPSGEFIGICYRGPLKKRVVIKRVSTDVTVDSTNGCCLLVPTFIFREAGLIDEFNCPHQYGDTEFQLRSKNLGFPTVASPSIKIKQLEATDYYSRINLFTMFNYAGSPIHFSAYLRFGKTLFRGTILFMLLGLAHHYCYLRSVLKSIAYVAIRQAAYARE